MISKLAMETLMNSITPITSFFLIWYMIKRKFKDMDQTEGKLSINYPEILSNFKIKSIEDNLKNNQNLIATHICYVIIF
jgi:hypothetical protein